MPAQSIIFSGPMVKAILEGRKTQTRRVIKPQPEGAWMDWEINTNLGGDNRYWVDGEPTMHLNMEKDFSPKGECRYGYPGRQIWVRETFSYVTKAKNEFHDRVTPDGCPVEMYYKANWDYDFDFPTNWTSPLFMPRWASRLTLEVTDVRVERLHAITEAGAIAEGVYTNAEALVALGLPPETPVNGSCVDKYRIVWESINGKTFPWSSNPFVWVIEFKKVKVEV